MPIKLTDIESDPIRLSIYEIISYFTKHYGESVLSYTEQTTLLLASEYQEFEDLYWYGRDTYDSLTRYDDIGAVYRISFDKYWRLFERKNGKWREVDLDY